jgi:hypothetical protein
VNFFTTKPSIAETRQSSLENRLNPCKKIKMLTRYKIWFSLGLMFLFASRSIWAAEELGPFVPNSRAPMDVRKGSSTSGGVNNSDLSEISGEFGGILYMAQRSYAYDRWPGKDISDCRAVSSGNACGECELIMGHSNANYYFFRDSERHCTLQQIDAHFQASDPVVLKSMRRTAEPLLGTASRDSKAASKEEGWDGTGSGWKWESSTDLAYLYMDTDQGSGNGDGLARFQWRRAPLLKSAR